MVSQSNENQFGIKLSDDRRISNLDSSGLIKNEELVQKIPLYNDRVDVTKKSENGNLKIEKKWITVKKDIEIPLRYEEIFINDKVFDSYSNKEISEIFFQIKNKISDVFLHERTDQNDNKQSDSTGSEVEIVCLEPEAKESNKNVISEKPISLSYVTTADQTSIQQPADQTSIQPADQTSIQETFELWGEEIIINKKMVKLAEIVIKKYQVDEKRKFDVEVQREKLTLKFPGNFKEEIS
jgi:stress response protein YsnF